jgi:hypothetical protein
MRVGAVRHARGQSKPRRAEFCSNSSAGSRRPVRRLSILAFEVWSPPRPLSYRDRCVDTAGERDEKYRVPHDGSSPLTSTHRGCSEVGSA